MLLYYFSMDIYFSPTNGWNDTASNEQMIINSPRTDDHNNNFKFWSKSELAQATVETWAHCHGYLSLENRTILLIRSGIIFLIYLDASIYIFRKIFFRTRSLPNACSSSTDRLAPHIYWNILIFNSSKFQFSTHQRNNSSTLGYIVWKQITQLHNKICRRKSLDYIYIVNVVFYMVT